MNDKIIEKIQKLISLGGSPNKHEAESAMAKAQELMTKHNIEMQSVEQHDSEYIMNSAEGFKRETVEAKYINSLLGKYFFVRLVSSRRNGLTFLNFIGEKSNVATAMHMRAYFTNVFKSLWKEYKKETDCPNSSKQSFYMGIMSGFSEKMDEQRAATCESMEMVLVNDPKVDEKVSELFPKLSKSRDRRVNLNDSQAMGAGHRQGRNLNINSGAIAG